MANIEIQMKEAAIVLATKGTYCETDIGINANLQDKTVTENGEVSADSGYVGLGAVTIDVHDIIDVDELPTSGVDTSKYYRMGDALYKSKGAVGTWLFNETLSSEWDGKTKFYSFEGTVRVWDDFIRTYPHPNVDSMYIQFYESSIFIGGNADGGDKYGCRFYYTSSSTSSSSTSLNGNYVSGTAYGNTQGRVLKTSEDGVLRRTITITKAPEEFATWLEANATRQSELEWDKYYIPTLQTKTVTENGTITPDSGYDALSQVTVNVPIPSGYIIPSGTATITENGTVDVTQYASAEVSVQPNLTTLTVDANGVYEASSYSADGFSSFNVNIPNAEGVTF